MNMSIIESLVKKVFSAFGLEIRWISPRVAAKDIIIQDPLRQNSLETLNDFYSDPRIVKEYLEPGRIAFYQEVVHILNERGLMSAEKNIVDIGCGTGHLLKFISELNTYTNLTGLEYSDAALDIAKVTCPNASFYRFDIYKGCSHKFDIILCTEVLEHLLFPDKALKNILKMINDKGTLILTVPDGRKDTFLGHINFWSPESWKVFVESNCEGLSCDTGLVKQNGANYAIIQR